MRVALKVENTRICLVPLIGLVHPPQPQKPPGRRSRLGGAELQGFLSREDLECSLSIPFRWSPAGQGIYRAPGCRECRQRGSDGTRHVVPGRCFHAIRRLCRITALSILKVRRTHLPVESSLLGKGACLENGVDGDQPRLFVVTH